ncbi:MAG: lmo0937 family membrane protein [Chitinophagaceae bacterium]
MRRVLFIIAALTAVAWLIGFFIFRAGMFIHISMMTSALCWMQAVIINPKPQVIR